MDIKEEFKLLSWKKLDDQTNSLFKKYKNNCGCYVAPDYLVLRDRVLGNDNILSLRKLYEEKAKNKKISYLELFYKSKLPQEDRLNQAALIMAVCGDLPALEQNAVKLEYYHNVLLGILTHRYLRLLHIKYKGDAQAARVNCAMFAAVEEILDLKPEDNNLNKLDSFTTEIYLSDLFKFLKQKNNMGQENHINYAYIKRDKEKFFLELGDMINIEKKKNVKMNLDAQYIRFVESVAIVLMSLNQPMQDIFIGLEKACEALEVMSIGSMQNKWNELVKSKLDNIQMTNKKLEKNLKLNETRQQWDKLKRLELSVMIFTNVLGSFVNNKLKEMKFDNFSKFQNFMMLQIANKSRYILYGAYVFVLEKIKSETELASTIRTLLNINDGNKLDFDCKEVSLNLLHDFTQYDFAEKQLNIKFVKPFSIFQTQLTKLIECNDQQKKNGPKSRVEETGTSQKAHVVDFNNQFEFNFSNF